MYDPSLFSRPSRYTGEPYRPEHLHDYVPPHYPTGLGRPREMYSSVESCDYNVALILVLGICGISICVFCAPFAWSMGSSALRVMDDGGVYEGSERTLVQVGRSLGIIGTILMLVGIVAFFLLRGSQ